jgi:gamma-glutamylcyclotransferase (GGCT)/AIG2-like uncharacterized protein YtfP
MNTHVFTYGSLMFAEVWQRVVRGQYAACAATLDGYRRFAVRDETYPGIVVSKGNSVAGLVYTDVDAADVTRLDQFEGELYDRIDATVTDAHGGAMKVQTYLFLQPSGLTDQPWVPQSFALQQFLATYCVDKLGG